LGVAVRLGLHSDTHFLFERFILFIAVPFATRR
jgi:hypothetical protein